MILKPVTRHICPCLDTSSVPRYNRGTIRLRKGYNKGTERCAKRMYGNLKILRQRRALSLTDLAQMTKLKRATINRIENGKQKPRPRTIRILAKALGVSVEDITSDQARLI